MREKGFTLIELLGVLVILGLLAALLYPLVNKNINQAKNDLYTVQKENILEAAKDWGAANITKLPVEEGKSVSVTLKQLEDDGFIEENLQNPKDKKPLDNLAVKVIITYKTGVLKYTLEGM